MLKKSLIVLLLLVVGVFLFLEFHRPGLSDRHGQFDFELFTGTGEQQPLIVGFGGGEGGNAWASDYWKETRDQFLDQGYALLAVGYFGMDNTAPYLDRIPLDQLYQGILEAANDPRVDTSRIALIGGSKGGELVLNLASRYPDIDAVVAIVPSHVTFPGLTYMSNTSSWTYKDEEVPFILPPYKTVPAMLKGDLYGAFSMMLEDEEAVTASAIAVEKIGGPVLLVSATKDEQWPSTEMSEKMISRLKNSQFPHFFQHVAIDGGHAEPLEHFDLIFDFLSSHFLE